MNETDMDAIMRLWHDVTTAPPSTDYHDGWNNCLLAVREELLTLRRGRNEYAGAKKSD